MVSKVQKKSVVADRLVAWSLASLMLLAMPFYSGCHWLRPDDGISNSKWKVWPIWKRRESQQTPDTLTVTVGKEDPPTSEINPDQSPDRSAENRTVEQLEQLLAETVETTQPNGMTRKQDVHGWYRKKTLPGMAKKGGFRWHHSGLTRWIELPGKHQPPLHAALQSKNPLIRSTATIGLARLEGTRHIEPLMRLIRTPTHPLPLRRAAIETLSRVDDPSVHERLVELIDYNNRLQDSTKKRKNTIPELHAELLRALSLYVRPLEDSHFRAALQSPSREVQIEVLTVFAENKVGPLPNEAIQVLHAPQVHGTVRIAALRAISACQHPEATSFARRATYDAELIVRLAGIETLGQLGGQEAQVALRQLYSQSNQRIREAAVIALAATGDSEIIAIAANEKSWRIRRAAATALATSNHGQSSNAAAEKLLFDSSIEVQLRAAESIARWPIETSGSLLFKAVESPNYRLRAASWKALTEKWPAANRYSPTQFEKNRQEIHARLWQEWKNEFGKVPKNPTTSAPPQKAQVTLDKQRLNEVQQLLERLSQSTTPAQRQQAAQSLTQLQGELVPAVEQLWQQKTAAIPEIVYRDMLPQVSPDFKRIEQLRDRDVGLRRRAAEQLAHTATTTGLSKLAIHRLAEVAGKEPDPLVWRHLLDCLANQDGEAAQRLAYAALWHRAPEVRRRVCPYFEAHGSARHLDALLPLLRDETSEVVVAATRAVAHCGPLNDPAPLLRLLSTSEKTIRVEAATSLVRLGFSDGMAAMERLSYDFDSAIRRQTAEAIGRLDDPLLLPILIRLLDDRDSVQRAALAALPRLVSEDIAARQNTPALTTAKQAELWKQWYQNGGELTSPTDGPRFQATREEAPAR